MNFQVGNRRKSMQKRIAKTSFFQHRFFIDFSSILASIWEGLGEVWGPKMGKLGIKQATWDRIAIFEGFGKGLGRVWVGFWAGFWEGFGKVWEPFGCSGGLPRLFCSCFGTCLGCPNIFQFFGYFCCLWLLWAVVGCFC